MVRRPNADEHKSAVRLVLRTLGTLEGFSETASGERVGRFGAGKPLSLLVYLAHSPNRSAPRDHLVELLWADVDPDAARHALRQTIWYVRRTLGEGVLGTDGDMVQLTASCDSDALAFLNAVDERNEDQALAVYAGDFLPAIAIPGGAEFERWADLERLRLRAIFTRTSESRVLHFLERGEPRLALPVARRGRDIDRGDERMWRRLLEVLIAASDIVGATAEADAFEHLWMAEDREMDAASRALVRRARNVAPRTDADAGAGEPTTLAAALVGRAAEFAALTGTWDEVQRDGIARHIHVAAPAGLGKTRLLMDFRSRLRASRSRTVFVRANPGERSLPYALISTLAQELAELPGAAAIAPATASILVQLNPALSSHFPEYSSAGFEPEPLRRRTVAVRELAAAVSDERPLAVLVDDLHWADRESLAVLAACAGNFGGARVLLVSTARGSARQWFAHEPREIPLHPLDPRSIAELVSSLGQLPGDLWADDLPILLLSATGGSPLLALETLQLAMERELLAVRDGRWTSSNPEVLRDLLSETNPVGKRVDQLDDPSRQLMVLLSAAGVPTSSHTLAQAAAMPIDRADGLLQALEVRGLVQHAREMWLPAHDEIAASILARLDASVVARARLAVAHAVASDPAADLSALRLAAELIVASGDSGELAELFARFTRVREASGVRGTPEEHLRALLGDTLPASNRQKVLRAATWRSRMGWRAAVGLLAIAVAAAGGVWVRGSADADVVLHLRDSSVDGTMLGTQLPLRPGDAVRPTLDLAGLRESRLRSGVFAPPARATAMLDGSGWWSSRNYPDSGGEELVFVPRSGPIQRLTTSPGDDGNPIPSPDGRTVMFNTSRYDTLMHAHVALLDVASRRVTRVDTTSQYESDAMWSPDGSRVAISRTSVFERRPSLCLLDSDGSHEQCEQTRRHALSWVDEHRLLAMSTHGGLDSLFALEANTFAERTLCADVLSADLSPDRRWLVLRGLRSGYDGVVYWLAPVYDPCSGTVLLRGADPVRQLQWNWEVRRPLRGFLTRLTIIAPDSLQSFAAVRLFVQGSDAAGEVAPVGLVRWRSLNPGTAEVSEDGLVVPRAPGTVRIVASAGGRFADTATLTIGAQPARLIERSVWSAPGAISQWMPFGVPQPQLDSSDHRITLAQNGDSTYPSGIRLRRPPRSAYGIVARLLVKTPLTRLQWQSINVYVGMGAPDSAWQRWDKRSGLQPQVPASFSHCSAGYPRTEGRAGLDSGTAGDGITTVGARVSDGLRAGRWAWLELQLLPDGRCGFAVDNVPSYLSTLRQPITRTSDIVISGQSHRTRILIDTVEVFEGVLHPEWWATLDVQRLRKAEANRSSATAPPARGRSSPP